MRDLKFKGQVKLKTSVKVAAIVVAFLVTFGIAWVIKPVPPPPPTTAPPTTAPATTPPPTTAPPARTEIEVGHHNSYVLHGSYQKWYMGAPTETYVGEFYRIVGVIENLGPRNAEIERVDPTFYRADGSEIDIGDEWFSWIWDELIAPNQKITFYVVLMNENKSREVTNYNVSVSYRDTEEEVCDEIEVLNVKSVAWNKVHQITGELMNVGEGNVEHISVLIIFYDVEGRVVGMAHGGYPPLIIVTPGQKVPFDGSPEITNLYRVDFPRTFYERISSYDLCVRCEITSEAPYTDLQILRQSSEIKRDGLAEYVVTGEVENTGSENVTAYALATFYDADNGVRGFSWDCVEGLGPGQRWSFEIKELDTEITHYVLQVSGRTKG